MTDKLKTVHTKTQQVSERIAGEIRAGILAPGDRMQGMRELAERFGVSFAVINSAYKVLEEQKLIIRKPRSGILVNPDLKFSGSKLIGLITSYGKNDIENYFEPLFEVASEMRVVPMVGQINSASNWQQTVSDLVNRRPDKILVDIEARSIPLDEFKGLCPGIPLCFCNRWEWYPERPEDHGAAVLTDYKRAYAEGLHYLLEHGHRRIVIIMQHRNPKVFIKQEIAYTLESNGLSWDSPEILICNREDIEKTPKKMVSELNSYAPTAILAVSDYIIHLLAEIWPFIDETERIGLFNLHYSQMRNHEFSSFDMNFKTLWEKALNPTHKDVTFVRPELLLRTPTAQALAI